jgi:hypothetical protein
MNPARPDTAGRFGFFASQIWGLFLRALQSAPAGKGCRAVPKRTRREKNLSIQPQRSGKSKRFRTKPNFLLENGHPTGLVPSLALAAKRSAGLSRRHAVPADAPRYSVWPNR